MSDEIKAISTDAIRNLITASRQKIPDISLGLALQAFAGIRCTEIPDLNSNYHPDGRSIVIKDDVVTVSLGLKQITIPDEFNDYIRSLYSEHMENIIDKSVDYRYPLFINSNGTKLSVDGYLRRIKQFGDYILDSDDDLLLEVKSYLLKTGNKFTGDFLRQWYCENVFYGKNNQ